MAITVAIHAVGLGIVLSRWAKLHPLAPTHFWPITWLLIRLAWWLIVIHLVEISIWGMFYFWRECLPDAESAFYFAGVTYTTILPPGTKTGGVNVTVPVELLESVTVRAASAVTGFPDASCRWTVMLPDA